MDHRSTAGRAADRRRSHRRPPAAGRRAGLFLGAAAAGAVAVNVLVGVEPAALAGAGTAETVSVASLLDVAAQPAATDERALEPLEQLAASRSSREAAQTAAQQAQAVADQAALDRQQAEVDAAARAAEAEAAAGRAAAEQAAAAERAAATTTAATAATAAAEPAAKPAATAEVAAATAAGGVARITNSTGAVKRQVQAAADVVVSNVPGADGIRLGGTRASAADPGGHPFGLALDYMVMSDDALGDAIAQYHIAHWNSLGVDYVIWQQKMLSSPNGSWQAMADRGSVTANHYDHVHVNYRG